MSVPSWRGGDVGWGCGGEGEPDLCSSQEFLCFKDLVTDLSRRRETFPSLSPEREGVALELSAPLACDRAKPVHSMEKHGKTQPGELSSLQPSSLCWQF